MLLAWAESKKCRAIRKAKFYLFDCGVTPFLAGMRALDRNSDLYGKSFMQFIGAKSAPGFPTTESKHPCVTGVLLTEMKSIF